MSDTAFPDDQEAVVMPLLSRRQVLKRVGAGGVALAIPGVLVACGGGSTSTTGGSPSPGSGQPISADRVTWLLGSGVAKLDVSESLDVGTWAQVIHILEPPLSLDPQGTVKPGLAESWDQPDPKTIVLKLRKGVKFHDGTELTAEDVAFSLSRNFAGETPTAAGVSFYGKVKSVEATGPLDVTISFKEVDPKFLTVLAHPAAFVSSKAYVEKAGEDLGTPKALPMGTGLMKCTKFNPSTGYSLERNDMYWGKPLGIKSFECRFVPDEQARLLAMQSGEADGSFDVTPDNNKAMRPFADVRGAPDQVVIGWSFPTDEAPFDDVHVRRAFAYATDSAALAKLSTPGARPANGVLVPDRLLLVASQDEVDALYAGLPRYDFNMDKAREELEQSAHAGGFEVEVLLPNTFPELKNVTLNTAQNLEPLGIRLNVKEAPEEQVLPQWLGFPPNEDHKGVGLLPTVLQAAPLPDPGVPLDISVTTKAIGIGQSNSMRYSNKELDAAMEAADTTLDKAARFENYSKVVTILAEDVPYHAAYYTTFAWAVRQPWHWNPDAVNPWMWMRPWLGEIYG